MTPKSGDVAAEALKNWVEQREPAVRKPRLADLVAAEIREDILHGRLLDGAPLPNQDWLSQRFGVSKASLREALRILESEHLVTVRQGRNGGVIVHAPRRSAAGYTLGLILQANAVPLGDLADTLSEIEPICTSMCAQRSDRSDFLPELWACVEAIERDVAAPAAVYDKAELSLHEGIAQNCGNATMVEVVGVLRSVWATQRPRTLAIAQEKGIGPNKKLRDGSAIAHRQIVELIEVGDAAAAAAAMRQHHRDTRAVVTTNYYDEPIRVSVANSEAFRGR